MNRSKRYSPEVRERAVRLVFDLQKEDQSQWAAIQSIADKIGCTHETLRRWVRQQERDQGLCAGLSRAASSWVEGSVVHLAGFDV
jgi:transposase